MPNFDIEIKIGKKRPNWRHITTLSLFNPGLCFKVILSPYGMAATLTGVTFQEGDPKLKGLLEEWKAFWPLNSNGYESRDASGQLIAMPEAVEVKLLIWLFSLFLILIFYFHISSVPRIHLILMRVRIRIQVISLRFTEFLTNQNFNFWLIFFPLYSDSWIRIFLRIRVQVVKILRIQRIRILSIVSDTWNLFFFYGGRGVILSLNNNCKRRIFRRSC